MRVAVIDVVFQIRFILWTCSDVGSADSAHTYSYSLVTQVAVPRSSGRHTIGRVVNSWPGWVRVDVEAGACKDVPADQVFRLLSNLRLD
jgi:hypothetical protein